MDIQIRGGKFVKPAELIATRGTGSALKPAVEDWWLLRKPFPKGYTVAQNVLEFGVGGLNINACRIETDPDDPNRRDNVSADASLSGATFNLGKTQRNATLQQGRWPSHLVHDGSDEVLAAFPDGSFNRPIERKSDAPIGLYEGHIGKATAGSIRSAFGDAGSAARFFHNTREGESRVFYTAKASSFDRNDGTYDLPKQVVSVWGGEEDDLSAGKKSTKPRGNHHATVKSTELMRWLCRLITPPGGTILDPFCGSGSTLKAAEIEGFSAIGIELDPAYVEIARRRIASDIPLFSETARKGYALTEEAIENSASETLWCSPYCVPERVSQFDLFAEIAA